ncbi:hypothetical protein NQZ68_015917 [Dissostichus eleginoides]|nr:hypothetical protein NQZ68_015917 [Dissostichus eleginoides]
MVAPESSSDEEEDCIETCVERYRAEPTIGLEDCPQQWWSKHEGAHSKMASLARKYLATPATSVPYCMQEDSRSDATKHVLKILVVHGANGEDPVDAALLLEGREMMPGCGSTAKACTLLMGLIYALNLAPPTLRYTFEVFQKLFLGLDGIKLTPKPKYNISSGPHWAVEKQECQRGHGLHLMLHSGTEKKRKETALVCYKSSRPNIPGSLQGGDAMFPFLQAAAATI